tara:strand:- start:36 stop:1334 length:1299 start_codon:yes stop_codon:yes gene_type:complete
MKKILFTLFFATLYFNSIGQCDPPINVFNSNINFYNADVNWNYQLNINKYKIRYKIVGTTSWSYKNNIDSNAVTKNLNNLTPLNFYLWQIRSYCDTTNTNYSQWSIADTFYTSTINCPSITGQFTNNINYNNATSNWTINANANRYKIRYKIFGTTSWSFSGPIYHPINNETIPLLQQNTTYEWEVMAYYDSTTQSASLWSMPDTFSTSLFISSMFDPIISNSIDNPICNSPTNLTLFASQSMNEPDIETTTITSDGGYFDIQTLSMGDSVGYATMALTTQTISTILKVGIIAGQNYALINSYDSTGSIIGFFSVENLSTGIKISSTSPNDGNNYTTGFTSEIHLTNLFVNPNIDGPLNFYTEIESELNDQFNDTATVMVNCISNVSENNSTQELNFEIYDLLGRKTKFKENSILLYKYMNGKVKKINTQKK